MQLWVKMLYSRVRHENATAITEAVLKLVGLLSVNEAGHLGELGERRSGRERKRERREREEEKTQLRSSKNKTKQNDHFSPGSDFHADLSSPRRQRRVGSSPGSPRRRASWSPGRTSCSCHRQFSPARAAGREEPPACRPSPRLPPFRPPGAAAVADQPCLKGGGTGRLVSVWGWKVCLCACVKRERGGERWGGSHFPIRS